MAVLIFSITVVSEILPVIVPILNVIGGLVAVVPPAFIVYSKYKTKKEIEEQFLVFLRDLTEGINSGMTLPIALSNCSKRDYLSLTPYVNDMIAQIDWGIPFKKALQTFAKKIKSVTIQRAVNTIIETYKVGGKISDTLSAVGDSLITISKIRKERTASVHSQLITSYLIFFVFIFILVILQTFLIPALTSPSMETTGVGGMLPSAGGDVSEFYTQGFINFIIVQGFFAGLVTGKMAEGSVVAGLKHSILLISIGYTVFSFVTQFQIAIF